MIGMALASLLFAPNATAANGQAAFTAQEATLLGNSTINGTVAAFVQENTGVHDELGSPLFRLEADRLRVESDQSNASFRIGSTGYRYDPHTMIREYEDVTVRGGQHRPDYLFLVFPMGELTASMREPSCAVADPSREDKLSRNARVTDRTSSRADTSQSMLLTGCADSASLTLQGDLLLRLWEWDADLEAGSQTRSLHSGRTATQPVPEENLHAATEQFLYARNATLSVPELSGHYQLHLDQATTTGSHSLHLRQAVVDVAGTRLADQEVRLQGDLSVDLRRSQDGLEGQTSGVQQARSDEAAWMITPQGATGAGATWTASAWLVLWSVVATAAMAVLAVWFVVPLRQFKHLGGDPFLVNQDAKSIRHRHAAVYARHGRRALEGNKHLRAVVWTSMAVALHPTFTDYRVWRLGGANKLRWRSLAWWDHRRLDAHLDNEFDLAENAFLAMLLELRRGRHDAVQRWFEHAIEHHAGIVYKIQDDARFAAIHDEAWFNRAASGGAPWWPGLSLRLRQ